LRKAVEEEAGSTVNECCDEEEVQKSDAKHTLHD
jgi:hypothetical protein